MNDRPNILWYCTDQQRFDTLGALGNPHVQTPTLDALIADGTALRHAYCQSPICTPSRNQGVQFPIARAHAELEAAELMIRKAAALFDDGRDCGAEANMAKMLASEAAWHAGDTCMQTFGGFGFAREFDIERKWREVRLFQTAPISTNLILAYIGTPSLLT